MVFELPQLAFAVLLIPLLLLAYIVVQRRRRRFALRYASASLVRDLGRGRGWRRHIPPLLFLLCLTVLILALMRPALLVREPSDEGIVVVTLDVSASMWANDMQPSRMEAAKKAAQEFVDGLPAKMRVGIVSFSETSYLNQVPTTDRDAIQQAITKLAPQAGTAIGNGLLTSLDAVYGANGGELPPVPAGTYAPAVIILLSDGENTDGPSPLDIVGQAEAKGIRVYTIGIGSPKSTTLQIGASSIQAKLDEDTLRKIAQSTNATYHNASSEQDLQAVYKTLTTQLVTRIQPEDISFIFLSVSFVLGITALLFSIIWSNRLP